MAVRNPFAPGGSEYKKAKRVLSNPKTPGVIGPSNPRAPSASSATPSTVAPPFDPELAARHAAANARRTTLLSDADVDLQQTAQQTGFQYNPATGQFGGFDPTNPFSQAALLAKTKAESTKATELGYQRGTRRSEQDFAQAGQLWSGSYQNAQQENDRVIGETRKGIQFDYDRGYDTLRRGFDDYVKRYLRRKRDIQTVGPDELVSL